MTTASSLRGAFMRRGNLNKHFKTIKTEVLI
jgi:hypothetical protein